MKKFLLFFLLVLSTPVFAQHHTFEIKDGNFVYNGRSIQIHSGEMHFARVPKAYWRHRLQMLKAMGLNTVATYVFWNYHNTKPGVWDFKTENRDIAEFVKIAQEEGMFVILRPGPYACAEWEFGGYPWWLQENINLKIRANNKPFLDSCQIYFKRLAQEVMPLQVTHGGPIIMVQAENEFGSYIYQRPDIPLEDHRAYNNAIVSMLSETGFDVPLFTSDASWLFDRGSVIGALPAANGEGDVENLKRAVNAFHNMEGPYFVAEYYPGWLHHWGEPFPDVPDSSVVRQLETYLKNGISFNIYMAHGGTNFGFSSGANYNDERDIQPDLTSYDYDAPISEAGWVTPKYLAIRELMKKYVGYPVPDIPAAIPVISLPDIQLGWTVDVLALKQNMHHTKSDFPRSFEMLNQGHGYVLYSRKFESAVSGKLEITGLRDYATVYVNHCRVGVLNRMDKSYSLEISIPAGGTLDILVENMGRINYGAAIEANSKGIISSVTLNDSIVSGNWEMRGLPFSKEPYEIERSKPPTIGNPVIHAGVFEVQQVGDVFLDMRNWGKGIVFVNGHNLGRYWEIGPQQTLYLPGAFLNEGKNHIMVFEQLNDKGYLSIPTVSKPILDDLRVK